MNNINNKPEQQSSSSIISNNNTNTGDNHTNDNQKHNEEEDDMNLVIAKQLFETYCKFSHTNKHIDAMSSILSSLTSFSSLPSLSLPTKQPSNTSSTTSTKTIQSIIVSFIELRSQYIGTINNHNNNTRTNSNSNNNNNTNDNQNNDVNNQNTITNRFSTNDDVFNYSLFRAALLTNSPIIIDAIIPYINYDFTTLSVPHDQIELIKQMNVINDFYLDEIYPTNYIVKAIVDATEKGHYHSIQHLINNYQLSPTIPICHVNYYRSRGCTNLLYYALESNNSQLIEYLLPLCYKSTNQKVLTESILNIASSGHLHLIKQFHNEYNINISQLQDQLQDQHNNNILHDAIQSNNIKLIDSLIEDIGLSVNTPGILQYVVKTRKWDIMKHLINKHNADTTLVHDALKHTAYDQNITPDIIDYIITTFNITQNEINDTTSDDSPLFSFAKNYNVTALKHLIEKYNVNPHRLFNGRNGKGNSLLHITLDFPDTIEPVQLLAMVKYLICELGLDVNQIGNRDMTPIELLVGFPCESNESVLPIFTLLLQHKAEIRDMNHFIQRVVRNKHFSILQHLIEIYQPPIDVNNVQPWRMPLFHLVIRLQPSIELIAYLLSLNTIDINQKDGDGNTPIRYAMTHSDLHIDIIQLLIINGATVTIDDWLSMFGELSPHSNPYQLFQCLNYFNNTFGFNVETFSLHGQQNSLFRFKTTPLLQFSLKQFKFRYSTIKYTKDHFNMVIIYRALIHHYKANVNDQDVKNNNSTVFHNLATYNHYELIQFTLLHSFHKPNIYLVNNKGETFLHILVSKYDQWCDVKYDGRSDESDRKTIQQIIILVAKLDGMQQIDTNDFKLIITDDEIDDRYDNLAKVLDYIIDLL